jgi:broad specificity phosphatase PhoE
MLKLYLVRHGWTAWHSERRIAGWADVPLDARGRAEAAAAGRWLAAFCGERPLALISSPVLRAHQTAAAIGAAFAPALPVELDAGIGETRVTGWEGRLVDDVEANDPTWPQFFKNPADFRFPDGETLREMQARVVAVVEGLRRRYARGEIILVAHADPLRSLIAHTMAMDVAHLYRLRAETGSISRVSLPSPGSTERFARPRLDFLNLTEHLRTPPND